MSLLHVEGGSDASDTGQRGLIGGHNGRASISDKSCFPSPIPVCSLPVKHTPLFAGSSLMLEPSANISDASCRWHDLFSERTVPMAG